MEEGLEQNIVEASKWCAADKEAPAVDAELLVWWWRSREGLRFSDLTSGWDWGFSLSQCGIPMSFGCRFVRLFWLRIECCCDRLLDVLREEWWWLRGSVEDDEDDGRELWRCWCCCCWSCCWWIDGSSVDGDEEELMRFRPRPSDEWWLVLIDDVDVGCWWWDWLWDIVWELRCGWCRWLLKSGSGDWANDSEADDGDPRLGKLLIWFEDSDVLQFLLKEKVEEIWNHNV